MDYYKVNLPQNNKWVDDYENWIEQSYSKGSANMEIDLDDEYGIIGSASKLDDIPILIGETDDMTIIDD